MKILVVNCGSSSLKYQLIDMSNEKVLSNGLVERIGLEGSRLKHQKLDEPKIEINENMPTHKEALNQVMLALTNEEYGAIKDLSEITAVGHRVVHGGEIFANSVVINKEVKDAIEKCIELAPLHNPANLLGINVCEELLPHAKMVAVFDTAFHQTMPVSSYLYALPYEYYDKYKIRRYGMHGTSHKYVSQRAADILGKNIEDINIITCHLGNGASVAAVEKGKSIDTSMGFTPLEGLVMGTRTGDIDPAVVTYIMEKEKLNVDEMNSILNKKSGVLGISGVSSDFRDIENTVSTNERSQIALDVFHKRVKHYIGAYMAEMGGTDAIVFTAGLGENSAESREAICSGLEKLGICLDVSENKVRGKEKVVSTSDSKVKILVIPTNEELMIARDTLELIK